MRSKHVAKSRGEFVKAPRHHQRRSLEAMRARSNDQGQIGGGRHAAHEPHSRRSKESLPRGMRKEQRNKLRYRDDRAPEQKPFQRHMPAEKAEDYIGWNERGGKNRVPHPPIGIARVKLILQVELKRRRRARAE